MPATSVQHPFSSIYSPVLEECFRLFNFHQQGFEKTNAPNWRCSIEEYTKDNRELLNYFS